MTVTYTMHPTGETCWLHRYNMLFQVEMSNGESGLYCRDCGGPSRPARRPDPAGAIIMARYERTIARRAFWRRLLGWRKPFEGKLYSTRGHIPTDPACVWHRPPRMWWQRWRFDRGRGRGCPICMSIDALGPDPRG